MSFYVRKLEEKLVYQVKFFIYIFKNEHYFYAAGRIGLRFSEDFTKRLVVCCVFKNVFFPEAI